MRRFVPIALSLSLVLVLGAVRSLTAQDEAKKEAPAAEAPKTDAAPPAAPAEKPIPPEVQAKLDAARKAVAEAVVAAEKAGLVETTIDPPPILDILVTGRANDAAILKAKAEEVKAKTAKTPDAGVSPEVFGAWHTGFGKLEGITAMDNVRIIPPSKGLTDWYRKKADLFKPLLDEARKAAPEAKPEPKQAEEPQKEEKAEEPKAETKKAEEPKPEAKKEEPKPEEPQAEESKPEAKTDDAKPADNPKPEESKL